MKKFLVLAALAALCVPAAAADLPIVKAQPIQPSLFGPYTGKGFYLGMNFGGAAGTVDASTPAAGNQSVMQANGQMGVTLGYAISMSSTSWIAIEGDFDWMGQSGGTLTGLSLNNGPMAFDQRLVYGGGIFDQVMKALAGIINLGTVPPFQGQTPNSVANFTSMYGFAGISEKKNSINFGATSTKPWSIAPELGMGMRTQYANGMATDVRAGMIFNDKSTCIASPIGDGCAGLNTEAFVRFAVLY